MYSLLYGIQKRERSDEVNLVLPEIQAQVALAGLFRWFFICGGQSGDANHLSPYD